MEVPTGLGFTCSEGTSLGGLQLYLHGRARWRHELRCHFHERRLRSFCGYVPQTFSGRECGHEAACSVCLNMGGHQRGPGHTMDLSCPRHLEAMYLSTWLGVLHHTRMPRPNERSASFCCAPSTAAVATQKGGRKVLASAGVSAVLLCLVLWLLTMASLSIWHSHLSLGGGPDRQHPVP